MNRFFLTLIASLLVAMASAQVATVSEFEQSKSKPFGNLDLSITGGTTGLGVNVSTKLTPSIQLRVGFSSMPEFKPEMTFGIEGGRMVDGKWVSTRFESMAEKMEDFTGYKVDTNIDMEGDPNFYNLNVLVDFFPFKKKNWFFTAGFYYGSSNIATAENTTADMASLLAVGMYNNMYEKILNGSPIMGDIYLAPELEDKFLEKGRMGIRMGEYAHDVVDASGNIVHKAGEPYMMEPGADCMVSARVIVNRFKPYLGFGYEGALLKRDPSYRISFNCGAMFWGGTPSLLTHDGTDLIKDVNNVRGKVGRYVDIINGMKVMPVLNISISKRLFE